MLLFLSESVFSHGFVNAADGRKMSKSYNNTVDPHEVILLAIKVLIIAKADFMGGTSLIIQIQILNKYSVDSFRYYMCASVTYGADLSFSESFLVTMHNSELADILGNLVHRALTLCQKYCDGKVPDTLHDERLSQLLPFDLLALKQGVEEDMKSCAIHSAIFKAMDAARATNRYARMTIMNLFFICLYYLSDIWRKPSHGRFTFIASFFVIWLLHMTLLCIWW